jgi:hypothetical protein
MLLKRDAANYFNSYINPGPHLTRGLLLRRISGLQNFALRLWVPQVRRVFVFAPNQGWHKPQPKQNYPVND